MASLAKALRTVPVLLNGDYSPEEAEATVKAGGAAAIVFGRNFVSNPDLPARRGQRPPQHDVDRRDPGPRVRDPADVLSSLIPNGLWRL